MENLVIPLTSDHDLYTPVNVRNASFKVKVPEEASKHAIELIETKRSNLIMM